MFWVFHMESVPNGPVKTTTIAEQVAGPDSFHVKPEQASLIICLPSRPLIYIFRVYLGPQKGVSSHTPWLSTTREHAAIIFIDCHMTNKSLNFPYRTYITLTGTRLSVINELTDTSFMLT